MSPIAGQHLAGTAGAAYLLPTYSVQTVPWPSESTAHLQPRLICYSASKLVCLSRQQGALETRGDQSTVILLGLGSASLGLISFDRYLREGKKGMANKSAAHKLKANFPASHVECRR